MLNKNKLAVQIAQRTGSSREAARTFPYTFCGVLTDALAAGEAIQLRGGRGPLLWRRPRSIRAIIPVGSSLLMWRPGNPRYSRLVSA